MDYDLIAAELLEKMRLISKMKFHSTIFECLRGEILILYYISANNGEALPGTISKEVNVSSARVAVALNNLENKNLITREIDHDDRRRILVKITDNGREFINNCFNFAIKQTAVILSTLGEHDAKEFVRIIGKLSDATMSFFNNFEENCH